MVIGERGHGFPPPAADIRHDHLDVADDERNAPLWKPLIERGRNAHVCWEIDVPKWKELLYSILK